MTDDSLPVVEPPFDERDTAGSDPARVVGTVLTAGTSSRFGERNKLLVDHAGTPLVSHVTRAVAASRVDIVVIVISEDAGQVQAAVSDSVAAVVRNDEYGSGQDTSVRHGVAVARDLDADAALFALGDMPAVNSESIDRHVSAYRVGVGDVLAAAHDGTRGNPVIFDFSHLRVLSDLPGDTGGRDILLGTRNSALIETGDPGVLIYIDRPEDLSKNRFPT